MSDRKPNLGPDSPDLSGDVPPGTAPLTSPPTEAKQPRKRFVGRKTADAAQAQKAESSGAAASTDKSLEKGAWLCLF